MKKIIVFLGAIFILVFAVGSLSKENEAETLQKDESEIIVAACPTFHYMLEKIESNKVKVIKTESTGESLSLLDQEMVDLVISGRALKSTEPKFSFKKIGHGYDFIFSKEVFILEEEMQFIPFYTDLPLENIIEDFPFISEDNLKKTEDIYSVLDKGVVITSLEGEIRGEIVHVLQGNGERVRLSRLPRLYYLPNLEEEKLKLIKL